MPKKSRTSNSKGKKMKTRKQKVINMIGCSKKHKHSKSCKSLGANVCPNCGPNCHCGPNCNCPHPCPGSCYLNRRKSKKSQKGGYGCGSCGCPYAPLSVAQMNKFGGDVPVIIDGKGYSPILGIGQNGGNCNSMYQSGGNFFKPASPIPGPFVGSSWGSSVNQWPSMNGISSDRNYLNSYAGSIDKDPQQQMSMADSGYNTKNSMIGGTNKKKLTSSNRKSMKAGGLVPQDLVNLGSNFSFNLKSAYNSLNGYNPPTNPLPYKDQLTVTNKFM